MLKVGAVSFGTYDPSENKALPGSLAPKPEYEVRVGDFLMSRANTFELVGACAPVEATPPKLMLSDKHFRFIFRDPELTDAKYLDHVLKSPALRDQIVKGATGTSPTMKNISKEKVLALLVPNHDHKAQVSIRRKLDESEKRIREMSTTQCDSAAELSALLPAILDRAFKGIL